MYFSKWYFFAIIVIFIATVCTMIWRGIKTDGRGCTEHSISKSREWKYVVISVELIFFGIPALFEGMVRAGNASSPSDIGTMAFFLLFGSAATLLAIIVMYISVDNFKESKTQAVRKRKP